MSHQEKSVQNEETMSYQEKRALVSLISSVLIFGFYCLYVFQRYQEQILSAPNDLGFWATAVFILIPVSIVATIIIHIVFVIINKIVTNEDAPSFTDERDKLIELKAIKISHWTFIFGFLLSMGSQVIDMQPYVMIIALIFSGFVASIVSDIATIYFYRKGF
jgi:hypothetical protein